MPLDHRALAALDAVPPRIDTPLLYPAPQGGLVNLDNWVPPGWALITPRAATPTIRPSPMKP